MTTAQSVQQSVTQLSRDRTRMLVQSRGFVSPVTDDLDPFAAPSQAHVVVEAGSVGGAVRGRLASDGGLTVLGGLIFGDQDYLGARGGETQAGSLALRYSPAGMGDSRPFLEIGGMLGRIGKLRLDRTYANGAGTAVGEGTTRADTSAYYGRAGWIWQAGDASQVGAYAEYGHQRQSLDGYVEPLSQANPFEAHAAAGVDSMDVGKVGLRFNHAADAGFEFGGGVALAHAFRHRQSLAVSVPGFGFVAADPLETPTWVEYGARVGYRVTRRSTLSLFVAGIAGSNAVDGHAHAGLDYRVTF